MPRIFLLLAIVLFILGAGLGTWWFVIRGEPLPFGGGGGEKKAEKKDGKPAQFVEMEPISVPVMDEGRAVRILSVVISVEVRQAATEIIDTNQKQLRDAFIKELHGLYSLDFVREHDNRSKIVRKRLQKVARDIIGPAVKGVFIKAVNRRETGS